VTVKTASGMIGNRGERFLSSDLYRKNFWAKNCGIQCCPGGFADSVISLFPLSPVLAENWRCPAFWGWERWHSAGATDSGAHHALRPRHSDCLWCRQPYLPAVYLSVYSNASCFIIVFASLHYLSSAENI